MKANEIKVGGVYRARISGNFVDVRVDAIRETTKRGRSTGYSGLPNYVDGVVYDATNLTTGRKTTFKTAGKFRHEVKKCVVSGSDQPSPDGGFGVIADFMARPPVRPGRRPNENLNPELEVMLRQVSPKINAEVREAVVSILGEDLVSRQEEIHAEEINAATEAGYSKLAGGWIG